MRTFESTIRKHLMFSLIIVLNFRMNGLMLTMRSCKTLLDNGFKDAAAVSAYDIFFFLSPRKTSPSLEFFCSPITFRIYSLDTHAFNVLTHAYKQPSSSLSVCLSRSSRPDLVRQSLSFASLIFSLLCLAFFSPAVVVRFVSPHFFLPPKNATSELHHVWRQKKRRKQMAVLYVRIHKYVAFCSKRGHK